MSDSLPKTHRPHRHQPHSRTSEPGYLPVPSRSDGKPGQSTDNPQTYTNHSGHFMGIFWDQYIGHDSGFAAPGTFDPHNQTSATLSLTTQYPATRTQETHLYSLTGPLSCFPRPTLADSDANTWSGAISQPDPSGYVQHEPPTGDVPRYGSPELAVLNGGVQTTTVRHDSDDRTHNRQNTCTGDSTWSTSVYQGSDVDADNSDQQGAESTRRKCKSRAEQAYAMQRFREDAHAPWTPN